MNVVLYSTHCPKCNILEKKLDQSKIEFTIIEDLDLMQEKGFMSAPMLEVDGKIYDFGEAVKWVNNKIN